MGGLPFAVDDVLVVLKLFYVLGILMYLVFAIVVVRQVGLMQESLKGQLVLPLKPAAWLHVLAVLAVLLLAIVLL